MSTPTVPEAVLVEVVKVAVLSWSVSPLWLAETSMTCATTSKVISSSASTAPSGAFWMVPKFHSSRSL